MGLDVVELIMRVEEEFEIEILDEEAEQCATPGALARLVSRKLGATAAGGCFSSAAFYQTRRALMASLGAPRAQIRPQTALETLFPSESRRACWRQFELQSGASLPALSIPRSWRWVMGAGFFAVAALPWLVFPPTSPLFSGAPFVMGIAFLWATQRWVLPLASEFPASCQTVGALSRRMSVWASERAPGAPSMDQPGEIWARVRLLIADELGVPLEVVTPDADFIRDLGAD